MWFWHISITSALIRNLPKIYETNTKSADETRLMTTCTCSTISVSLLEKMGADYHMIISLGQSVENVLVHQLVFMASTLK